MGTTRVQLNEKNLSKLDTFCKINRINKTKLVNKILSSFLDDNEIFIEKIPLSKINEEEKNRPKSKRRSVSVSHELENMIEKLAKKHGISFSEEVRHQLFSALTGDNDLEYNDINTNLFSQIRYELNKVGNNINMITKEGLVRHKLYDDTKNDLYQALNTVYSMCKNLEKQLEKKSLKHRNNYYRVVTKE